MILNNLPTIVTKPGIYITRNGHRVLVHEIKENTDKTTTSYGVKGSVIRVKGKKETFEYGIWHVSGRKYFSRETGLDIIGEAK